MRGGCTRTNAIGHLIQARHFICGVLTAMEASKRGVKVAEDTVLGIMLADDFMGISKPLEGLQKQVRRERMTSERGQMRGTCMQRR